MDNQDTKFNYKILLAALVAVIIGILIAFYYSYAQSQTEIQYLYMILCGYKNIFVSIRNMGTSP